MIDPSLTQTIRQFCDGELPPEEAQQFERQLERDTQLQQAVVFERNLRKRVATIVNDGTPIPASLADRVRAALDREIAPQPIPIHADGQSTQAGRPVTAPFAQPTWRINYLAVAAVLALVIGAVMFGVLSPQIDMISQSADVAPTELLAAIGSAVATEHDRIAGDRDTANKKLNYKELDKMSHELSVSLRSRVTPIDLSELGYAFFGAGFCAGTLPCGGPSAHLLFKKRAADGSFTGPNISLFVVPEDHLEAFLDKKFQRKWVDIDGLSTKCGHRVIHLDYPDTGLVYFLVTCDPNDLEPASEMVLEQLHASR